MEVVGGAIKSRCFRFLLFLIWVTVKPMFCQYLLLIFAPEWRKDAQARINVRVELRLRRREKTHPEIKSSQEPKYEKCHALHRNT